MKSYTREELLELAAGYALGALTPEETNAVEAAMVSDDDLRREVEAFRETAGTVMSTEPPMTPATSLRGRWLRRARGEPDARASSPATSPAGRVGSSPAMLRTLGTLLAASLVLTVSLGIQLQQSRRALEAERASLQRRERQLNTLLEAESELHMALLKPTAAGQEGIQFYWNARQNRGMLHAFHLAPAPAGRAYQLWVIRDGTPVSVRVFNSDADGHALVEQLELPATAAGVSVVAITVEPEGGSPQPTSTPILAGPLVHAQPR